MGSTGVGMQKWALNWVWVTEVWFDSFELGWRALNWVWACRDFV
jgi:hypothetical protein